MRSVLAIIAAVVAGGSIRHVPTEAAADPVPRAVSNEVRSIALDARDLSTSNLRDALATHAGDLLDLTKLAQDRQSLEATLIADGYLDAKVSDAKVIANASGAFVV